MTKTIEYNNKTYELVNEENEYLTFKLLNKYENYSLHELGIKLNSIQEELKNQYKESEDYQRRVDEFRYCGYNEEDPDFHGMCLHQNHLDNIVNELENEKDELFEEIEKRCEKENIDYEDFLFDYEIEY